MLNFEEITAKPPLLQKHSHLRPNFFNISCRIWHFEIIFIIIFDWWHHILNLEIKIAFDIDKNLQLSRFIGTI